MDMKTKTKTKTKKTNLSIREVDALMFEMSTTKCTEEFKQIAQIVKDSDLWSPERLHWDFARGNVPHDEPYRRVLKLHSKSHFFPF